MSFRRSEALRVVWRAVVAAMILLSCASCTELERVPQVDVNSQQLVGRVIRVTTIDGQVYDFRLLEVTADALVGEFERVPFDQIALVERRDVSFWRTACLVGGGALAAVGGFILLLIATWKS